MSLLLDLLVEIEAGALGGGLKAIDTINLLETIISQLAQTESWPDILEEALSQVLPKYSKNHTALDQVLHKDMPPLSNLESKMGSEYVPVFLRGLFDVARLSDLTVLSSYLRLVRDYVRKSAEEVSEILPIALDLVSRVAKVEGPAGGNTTEGLIKMLSQLGPRSEFLNLSELFSSSLEFSSRDFSDTLAFFEKYHGLKSFRWIIDLVDNRISYHQGTVSRAFLNEAVLSKKNYLDYGLGSNFFSEYLVLLTKRTLDVTIAGRVVELIDGYAKSAKPVGTDKKYFSDILSPLVQFLAIQPRGKPNDSANLIHEHLDIFSSKDLRNLPKHIFLLMNQGIALAENFLKAKVNINIVLSCCIRQLSCLMNISLMSLCPE